MANGIRATGAAVGMLILILDGKTALLGARDALELCINAVVPALFPFFVLSPILVSTLSAHWLRPLGRLCRVPEGAEPLLLVGFLGGYPTGAQCIANCYRDGALVKEQAQRLLGFCSNAGPSFIFGILGSLFRESWVPWILWAVHILAAIFAGILLPPVMDFGKISVSLPTVTLKDSLGNAVKAMASVCGWVILFRILIGFLNRYFLWILPDWLSVIVAGILELTNGCLALQDIPEEGLRFLICAGLLSFGGICVTMQTISITDGMSIKWYLIGKLYQTGTALILALFLQSLFSNTVSVHSSLILIPAIAVLILLINGKKKNSCSNPGAIGV